MAENKEVKKEETKKDGAKFEQVTPEKAKAEEKAKKKENKKEEKVKGKVTVETKKKSKKNILIYIVTIILILVVIAGIAFSVLRSTPETTVDRLLKNLKNGNFQEISEYINSDLEQLQQNMSIGGQELDEEAYKLIFEKLEWKINKEEINGDNAAVEVEVTNKDFQVILTNYTQKLISAAFTGTTLGEEQYKTYLMDELRNESVATRTTTQTINLVKVDGNWQVVINDTFMNLLLPGLQETINSINLLSE